MRAAKQNAPSSGAPGTDRLCARMCNETVFGSTRSRLGCSQTSCGDSRTHPRTLGYSRIGVSLGCHLGGVRCATKTAGEGWRATCESTVHDSTRPRRPWRGLGVSPRAFGTGARIKHEGEREEAAACEAGDRRRQGRLAARRRRERSAVFERAGRGGGGSRGRTLALALLRF